MAGLYSLKSTLKYGMNSLTIPWDGGSRHSLNTLRLFTLILTARLPSFHSEETEAGEGHILPEVIELAAEPVSIFQTQA